MGLDIYMSRWGVPFGDAKAVEDAYEKESEALYEQHPYASGEPKSVTAKRDAAKRALAERLGVRADSNYFKEGVPPEELHHEGDHRARTRVERNSAKYPEHYFKIGYFRSSYNNGGINNVAAMLGVEGGTLGEIFAHDEDEYEWVPDWPACRSRAVAALEAWRKRVAEAGGLSAEMFTHNPFASPRDTGIAKSEPEALQMALEAMKRGGGAWSNLSGTYFTDKPLMVRAVLPGVGRFIGRDTPCFYVISEQGGQHDWYLQALEIVIETCDFVLASGEPDRFSIRWSG